MDIESFKKKRAEYLKTPEGKKVTKRKEAYQKKQLKAGIPIFSGGKIIGKKTPKSRKK